MCPTIMSFFKVHVTLENYPGVAPGVLVDIKRISVHLIQKSHDETALTKICFATVFYDKLPAEE